jgi:hypothetical protein
MLLTYVKKISCVGRKSETPSCKALTIVSSDWFSQLCFFCLFGGIWALVKPDDALVYQAYVACEGALRCLSNQSHRVLFRIISSCSGWFWNILMMAVRVYRMLNPLVSSLFCTLSLTNSRAFFFMPNENIAFFQ